MSPRFGSRQKIDKMPYSHDLYTYVQGLMEYACQKYIQPKGDSGSMLPIDEESKLDTINRLAT